MKILNLSSINFQKSCESIIKEALDFVGKNKVENFNKIAENEKEKHASERNNFSILEKHASIVS